jgi:hypothetical protein
VCASLKFEAHLNSFFKKIIHLNFLSSLHSCNAIIVRTGINTGYKIIFLGVHAYSSLVKQRCRQYPANLNLKNRKLNAKAAKVRLKLAAIHEPILSTKKEGKTHSHDKLLLKQRDEYPGT